MSKTYVKNYTEEVIGKNSTSDEFNPFNKTANNHTNATNTSRNVPINITIATIPKIAADINATFQNPKIS